MDHRLGGLVLSAVVALGAVGCGAQTVGEAGSRGDGANRGHADQPGDPPGDDTTEPPSDDPPVSEDGRTRGIYVVETDDAGRRSVTLRWGNSDRTCEAPEVFACGYANGSVTLAAASVASGASVQLEDTTGYMTASGRNEGGSGPDDCWGGGGSLTGVLTFGDVDLDAGRLHFSVTGSAFFDPSVDGEFFAYECAAPEEEPEAEGPPAVFEQVSDGQIRLSWGSVERVCGDAMTVACDEAKAEVTLEAADLQVGAVIDLSTLSGLEMSSGVNTDGSGPDDCWWGGGSLFGELEIISVSETLIRFRVSGTDWDDPNVDGIFTATICI